MRGGFAGVLATILLAACALAPPPLSAQAGWRDLVVTGGFSGERYRGNLAAVTLPVADSTDRAAAAVGEFGTRGLLWLHDGPGRRLSFAFDGGLRQFAASGFEPRDYAPREWAGRAGLTWMQMGAAGTVQAEVGGRGRSIEDRPPMPLFLQPGYGSASASLRYRTPGVRGVQFDMEVNGELTDYTTLELLPQLDLLDRRARGVELGALLPGDETSTIRVFGGYRLADYRHQRTGLEEDPFRRDHTIQAGATWDLASTFGAQLGVEGTLNRSNSRRPEYDAVTVRGVLSAPLPRDFGLNVLAVLTGKSYVHPAEYARLVPGEEADNASVVYLELNRPISPNLDAALRLGWTRAETDFAESHFQRFGLSVLLNFRPLGM